MKAEKAKIETYKSDVKQLHETLEKRENEVLFHFMSDKRTATCLAEADCRLREDNRSAESSSSSGRKSSRRRANTTRSTQR